VPVDRRLTAAGGPGPALAWIEGAGRGNTLRGAELRASCARIDVAFAG